MTATPPKLTRRAAAEFADVLDMFANEPEAAAPYRFHCLTVRPHAYARAAALIRLNLRTLWTVKPRCCPPVPSPTIEESVRLTVKLCGGERQAIGTIRSQLEAQGAGMDPADVTRCARAADTLERGHYLTTRSVPGGAFRKGRKWVQTYEPDPAHVTARGDSASVLAAALDREAYTPRYGGTPTLTIDAREYRRLVAAGFVLVGDVPQDPTATPDPAQP